MFIQFIILLLTNLLIVLAGKCPSGNVLSPCQCHDVSKSNIL